MSGETDTAGVGRVERVRELEHFALRRLPALQLGDGMFCAELQVTEGGARVEGRSLRDTLVVVLGLLRAEEHGLEHEIHLGALRSLVLSQLDSAALDAGDLGLALWGESRGGGGAAHELAAALDRRLADHQLDGLASAELAWILTGLTEAGARGDLGPGERILARCREQLLGRRRPRHGLVTHAARAPRRRAPSFEDQIFAVLALSQLARIRDDSEAREAATGIADLLIEHRLPSGAWPWLYDPWRATVVDPYDLYTVNQDSLAMIAMHGLSEATGEQRYRAAAVHGLDWSFGGNELGVQMLDSEAGLIYRSIRRKQRFPGARQARNAAAGYLRATAHLVPPEQLEVDRTMRPSHLGWLLEAWAGREERARAGDG